MSTKEKKSIFVIVTKGTGTSCKKNFQTGFVVAGDGFLSCWNHSLKRRRDSDVKNNYVIRKRERLTPLKIFLANIFLRRYPCAVTKLNELS